MLLQTLVLAALVLGSGSQGHAGESELFTSAAPAPALDLVEAEFGPEQTRPVAIDPRVARSLSQHPDASLVTVDEATAIAQAKQGGVTLKPWGHPWVIIKAGIGVPGNINAQIEIYVHQNWSFEVGAGTGLLGTYYNGTVRWHPDATTWNWFSVDKTTGNVLSENTFQLGWGVEEGGAPGGSWGTGSSAGVLYVAPNLDAQYIHRFTEHFGWTFGTKVGIGPAFARVSDQVPYNGVPNNSGPTPPEPTKNPPSNGGPAGPSHIGTDMVLVVLIYTGFTF